MWTCLLHAGLLGYTCPRSSTEGTYGADYRDAGGGEEERWVAAERAGRGRRRRRERVGWRWLRVVPGTPAVGDGGGLEEGEVAADHPTPTARRRGTMPITTANDEHADNVSATATSAAAGRTPGSCTALRSANGRAAGYQLPLQPMSPEGASAPRHGPKAGDRLPDAPVSAAGGSTRLLRSSRYRPDAAGPPPRQWGLACLSSGSGHRERPAGTEHVRPGCRELAE
jgi:hypothetical protein